MLKLRRAVNLGVPIMAALLLSSCGAQISRQTTAANAGSSWYNPSGSSSTTVDDEETSSTNNLAPIEQYFENIGTGSTSFSGIKTDDRLKVTVTLGDPTNIPGTGYTAMYSCAKFLVTVAGQSQQAFVTRIGIDINSSNGFNSNHPCYGAVTSKTLDFSSRMSAGHGPVTVIIKNISYDNCRLYGNVYGYFCPMTTVYSYNGSGHVVTGNVAIHTNSTR